MSRGYVNIPRLAMGEVGLAYSGVDFGCFSTVYGDCEALEKREEQTDFTLFVCVDLASEKSMTSRISRIA